MDSTTATDKNNLKSADSLSYYKALCKLKLQPNDGGGGKVTKVINVSLQFCNILLKTTNVKLIVALKQKSVFR